MTFYSVITTEHQGARMLLEDGQPVAVFHDRPRLAEAVAEMLNELEEQFT